MAGYIASVPGILKLVTALVGVIIFGLTLAAWPRETVRELAKDPNSEIALWKFYIFFGFAIVALLFSAITILVFVFAGKSAGGLKMGDAVGSILIGILLLIGAALLLQEIVKQYNDLVDLSGCKGLRERDASFSKATFIKSVEDEQKEITEKCAADNALDLKNFCYCLVKSVTKYSLNVAAGAFGVINSVILMAAGGVGFAKK